MKAALVDPSLYTWAYDRELIQGLRDNGVEAMLYAKHLAPHEAAGPLRQYIVQHFYPSSLRSPVARLPAGLALAAKGLSHARSMARLIRRFREMPPDVIHFQWTPLPMLDRVYLAKLRRIAPLALTVHDSTPFNGNPASRLQKVGAIKILAEFDGLIVHTEEARRRLVHYGIGEQRINVIPHGLLQEGGPRMARLSIADDRDVAMLTFLMFGKIKPYKGVDVVINAVGLLPEDVRRRCRVRIVGKPYMDLRPLQELVARLNLADTVGFDPRLIPEAEIAGVFEGADVVVMPYRQIDASGVLMMALIAGRPIIASNIGNFAETLTAEQNALLVKPDVPSELAAAMARLVEDRALRVRLAAGVQTLRQTIPSWTEIGSRTAHVYKRLVTARSASLGHPAAPGARDRRKAGRKGGQQPGQVEQERSR